MLVLAYTLSGVLRYENFSLNSDYNAEKVNLLHFVLEFKISTSTEYLYIQFDTHIWGIIAKKWSTDVYQYLNFFNSLISVP